MLAEFGMLTITRAAYFHSRCKLDITSWDVTSFVFIILLMNKNYDILPAHYCRHADEISDVSDCLGNVNKFYYLLNIMRLNLIFADEVGPKQLALLDTETNMPSNLEWVYTSNVLRKITNTSVFHTLLCYTSSFDLEHLFN